MPSVVVHVDEDSVGKSEGASISWNHFTLHHHPGKQHPSSDVSKSVGRVFLVLC